jgi:hypothetical protein
MRNRRQGFRMGLGRALAIAACTGCAIVAATAPAAATSKRVQQACLADYKNLCPQYRTSSPQLRACMESKANEISWNCIQALIDSGEVDRKRVTRR